MLRPTSFGIFHLVLVTGLTAIAGDCARAGDDDEIFQSSARASSAADKAKRRIYVGARDEGRLEVQTSLSQPTRSPDGSAVVLDEADEPVTAPATD